MKCEFIMLFYPTTSENTIKLQKINELKPVESIEIALPIVHSNPSLKEFQKAFLKFMQ